MSKLASVFSTKADIAGDAQRSERILSAVKTLIGELPADEQQRLLVELQKKLQPIPAPNAGEVLGTIVHLLPKRREWTVGELKKDVGAHGVEASAKEIYNALGYLTRKRKIQRVGYGRYIVEGIPFFSSDDFGGAPSPPEIDDT